VALLFNIIIYILIVVRIRRAAGSGSSFSTAARRILLLPLILVFTMLGYVIRYSWRIFTPNIPILLLYIQALSGLGGFLNAIVYGLSPQVYNSYKNIFIKLKCCNTYNYMTLSQPQHKAILKDEILEETEEEPIVQPYDETEGTPAGSVERENIGWRYYTIDNIDIEQDDKLFLINNDSSAAALSTTF